MSEIGGINTSASQTFLSNMDTSASGDLETVMLSLSYERANTLDGVVQAQVQDMKDRNASIQKIQKALQEIRSRKPSEDKKGKKFDPPLSTETLNTLKEYGLEDNLTDDDTKLNSDGAYASLTENLKTEIDKQSSNSQLDMIKLQGLINKRNQTVELMTNLLQKFSQLQEKIVGNIR
jgi:hypothetical protein